MALSWGALAAVVFTVIAPRAEPFTNLDCEGAITNNVVPFPGVEYPSGQGLLSDLLPGWSFSLGGTEYPAFFLNVLTLDGGGVSLLSPFALEYYRSRLPSVGDTLFPFGIEGKCGFAATVDEQKPIIIAQTGDVPSAARFISLEAYRSGGVEFEVYATDTLVENGEISAYAGATVRLEILMRRIPSGPSGITVSIDSIVFGEGPRLRLLPQNAGLLLIWNSVPTNFVLQASHSLAGSSVWKELQPENGFLAPALGTMRYLRVPRDGAAGFFRLMEMPPKL